MILANRQTLIASLIALARTLAIGVLGGAVFAAIGMPVPWLSGPALAVAISALARVDLAVPNWLRMATLVFLGTTMGAAVTPDTLATLQRWPISIAGLCVCVMAIMAGGALYLQLVHGFDRTTARLSAVPGALPYVMAMAELSNADIRRVAIVQTVRLACLLMLLPSVLTLIGLDDGGQKPPAHPVAGLVLWHLPVLFAGGYVGALVFEKLKVPAAPLFGSMVVAALLYGSGVLSSRLPDWLMTPGLVVIGSMVGSNFANTDLLLFRRTAVAAVGCLAVCSAIALACAVPVAMLVGEPVAQIWLAYAPGGVETMAVMALALGLDAAFVGGHHLVRFFGLGLYVPFWLRGSYKAKSDGPHDPP